MARDAFLAIWFLLPAAVANMTPIFFAKLPVVRDWDAPLDFGYTLRGRELFGSHKTWRGIISGTMAAMLVFWLQQLLYGHAGWLQQVCAGLDYASLPLIVGPLLGFGALAGDAIKSFFKRQSGVPSGQSWFPFDQLDYIAGAVLVSLCFVILPLGVYIWIFIIWFAMHLAVSYLGWRIGLKDAPI
jgi:CDP-2,3-bis-(O-geranylgeranyl)-sn-glycerol synthase